MADQTDTTNAAYRVLARKYRPQTFDELIGQEAMVRTLANAIDSGRLAHAFLMTGVRGVGKTTTARLIARALNCVGKDGKGGPTVSPCGVCDSCTAIAESRHVDILEMDAASRTGVDDIREIISGVQYAPASARFKVYIIDEVHMLSKNAFNALLKTLEEPPEHVKFIFATTEVRKLPVTVLSRCQRFDLRRVAAATLVEHFSKIVKAEKAKANDAALAMIARAAEGSVRDGLSLLDQAIAHGGGEITEDQIRDMLGLADRARVLDLFKLTLSGETPQALKLLREQYDLGADPVVILQDMLEVAHWLTRLKVVPDAGTDTLTSEAEREQGSEMAKSLAMPHLTRAWQMMLKGLGEVRTSPNAIQAAEMVLIRLAYAADLPSPADLVRDIKSGKQTVPAAAPASAQAGNDSVTATSRPQPTSLQPTGGTVTALRPDTGSADVPKDPVPVNFEALVALFDAEKEGVLSTHLRDNVNLVEFRPGRLELNVNTRRVPRDFLGRVRHCLEVWTGMGWAVVLSEAAGEKSLAEQEQEHSDKLINDAASDPLVASILATFPGAKIARVIERQEEPAIDPQQFEADMNDNPLDDDF